MCIAIYQSPGYRLTPDELANSWQNNSDGAGLSFYDSSGEIVVEKSMNRSEFVDIYNKAVVQHGDKTEMAVHFRIATHGGVNIDNCHPFYTPNKNMSVIHNGIIPVVFDSKKDPRSDTRVFVEDVLPLMPENWIDNEQLFNVVEEYIGHSKLVVLSTDSEHSSYIFNEHMGHWSEDKKIWFSNKSYCAYKSGTVTVYKGGGWHTPKLLDAAEVLEDTMILPKCALCDEAAVYDDTCYNCETCQLCGFVSWTNECCKEQPKSAHDATQAQWERINKLDDYTLWRM
jgi:hypothetical protein